MDQQIMDEQQIMKGRSKHLLWAVLAFLLCSTALNNFQEPLLQLISRSADSAALPVVLAVAKTLLQSGSWFAILLLYALSCNVKTYKVIFIVLAAMQIPSAAGGFLSSLYIMRVQTGQGGNGNEFFFLLGVASALNIINLLAWVACLAVVVFSKWSGALLRVAAGVLALHFLLSIVYSLTAQYLYDFLIERSDPKQFSTTLAAINAVQTVFYLLASGFFFGVMSFGKHRQPKAPQAAVSA